MAKVIRKELEAKLAALDGAEWDSMSEASVSGDEADDQLDGELKPPPLPLRIQKKGKRKGKGAASAASVVPVGPAGQPSGVVYLGHIPHGFYEEAMNGFFKQFGDVIRVRISRSKKSGRCKGYAFVEFSSPEVAGIVAQTMNGYFLFDKQLVCRVLRFEEIHPNLFDGAGVKFRKVNWHGLYRQKYNVDRTPEKDEKHTSKLLRKDKRKRSKLAALGIDYDFPGFVATLNDREAAEGPFKGVGEPKEQEREGTDSAQALSSKKGKGKDALTAAAPPPTPSPSPAKKSKATAGAAGGVGKGAVKSGAKTPTKSKAKSPGKVSVNTPPVGTPAAKKTPAKVKSPSPSSSSSKAEAPSSKKKSAAKTPPKKQLKEATVAAAATPPARTPKAAAGGSSAKGSAKGKAARKAPASPATAAAGPERKAPKSSKKRSASEAEASEAAELATPRSGGKAGKGVKSAKRSKA